MTQDPAGEKIRFEAMAEALHWAADWLDSVGQGDEVSGYIRANARAASENAAAPDPSPAP